MPKAVLADRGAKFFRALVLLLSCGLLLMILEPVQPARAATTAADDFNRADGGLGSNWTAVSSGGLAISSQVVVGTSSGGETGDTWAGSSFGSNQFSQITLTSAQLSGGHWIAAMVRAQTNGQTGYAALYFWNYGNPELMLFKRTSGNWAQLGGVYSSGVLPAGTQLQVRAVGSTISLIENGVQRLSVTDTGITAGAPGIMAYGTTAADNWSGGSATGSATYTVGGSVSGLSGTVVLQDNGGDNLSASASGPFTFATALAGGTAYSVTVKTNPTGQTCTVSNGTGTIAAANVTNVAVSCTNVATYTVGGSVSGLSGTVVLQDNGGDNLSASASGPFTFATALAGGTAYSVTVKTNPTGQTCTVSNGTGTIAAANVTNVAVSCTNVATYTVGGSVSGLSGTVVLQDNGGDNLSLLASGPFTFATALAGGTAYSVTVKTNPSGQSCTVSGGSGTIGSANVTNVAVSCTNVATYTVGGSVSGLSGTVVLQDNGGDNLSLSANGPFTFATALAAGTAYTVTVLSNPAAQSCSVSGGSGTIASANVTTVTLTCAAGAADDFNRADGGLGSNWTAVSSGGLAISSQVVVGTSSGGETGDTWAGSSFGSNQFSQITLTSAQLSGGQWIAAMVRAQTNGQTGYAAFYFWNYGNPELMLFKRTSGNWAQLGGVYSSGALPAGTQLQVRAVGSTISLIENGVQRLSVTDTGITAGAPGIMAYGTTAADNWSGGSATGSATYTVGGSVSGLSGTVVLQDNGGDNLSASASGPFTFATALAGGTAYSVTVKTNPTGQTCTVSNGTGTIAAANVTNVAVSCTNVATYTVGGSVSGLSGTVVLQDNGGDNLSLLASGPFTFATALAGGTAYSVTVKTNPSGQSCTVSGGSGTIGSANVTNVAVSCTNVATYTVGGSVSGLSGTVVLQDNGGDNLSLSANGPFTFATALAAGTAYTVTVLSNPAAQSCSVSGGSGTIASANVTTVTLTCAAGAADDFNRADGGLGSNWTAVSSGGLAISSQVVVGTSSGGETGDTWAGSSFGSNQFSQITLTSAQLSGGQWIAAMVRAQTNGQTGYAAFYFWNYGNPELMLFKRTSGNWAQLGGVYSSGALPAGTQLQVRAVGSTISLIENGVQRLSVTDTGITAGAPGIMAYGTTAADNWSGGSATGSATYTVGGSVSGLSGTVVLQDNGGDNLSASASGPFTFATALAGGTAYSVTVKTNPTGQTCTVSNGTGTIAAANVTNVTVTCTASSTTSSASDDFNRADGSLGPNWTDISDGGLAVSAQAVTGTVASGNSGDIRTGESYDSNQFSQIEVSAMQLTGNQWIGPAVRVQAGGQEAYVGIYNWNNGSPSLMLFERNGGSWSQIGSTYNCGPLAAGTKLKLMVVGDTIAFLQDGVERIAAAATDLSGGAPGILANGTPQADNWSGGEAGLRDSQPEHRRQRRAVLRCHLRQQRARAPGGAGPAAHEPGSRRGAQLPLRAAGRGRAGQHIRRRAKGPARARRPGQIQPDHHRAVVQHPILVRGQPDQPRSPARNVPDPGTSAVGEAEPGDQWHRAELADRLLEVRHWRAGPHPEASGYLHAGCLVGLPGGHLVLRPVQQLSGFLRHGRELPGQLPADGLVPGRTQGSVPDQ